MLEQMAVNGRLVPAPYVGGDMEVSIYGAIMYEVRFNHLGHILTFTPQNNEFQLQLSPKTFASKMYGLCGKEVLAPLLFCAVNPAMLPGCMGVGAYITESCFKHPVVRVRASLRVEKGQVFGTAVSFCCSRNL